MRSSAYVGSAGPRLRAAMWGLVVKKALEKPPLVVAPQSWGALGFSGMKWGCHTGGQSPVLLGTMPWCWLDPGTVRICVIP